MSKKFDEWEKHLKEKRVGEKGLKGQNKGKDAPNSITVQLLSSQATGKSKKYEALDTRDFVDFSKYTELTLENVKAACESFYNAPLGSCDILVGDRGPSCFLTEQIQGKKVFYVRFITSVPRKPGSLEAVQRKRKIVVDSDDEYDLVESRESCPGPVRPKETTKLNDTHTGLPAVPVSAFPKSVSIADLLKARKLVQSPDESEVLLTLEAFDIVENKWENFSQVGSLKKIRNLLRGASETHF